MAAEKRHSPWTLSTAAEESRKYVFAYEFAYGSPGAYKASRRNGWLKTFLWLDFSPKKYKEKYTKEHCMEVAKSCDSVSAFRAADLAAYRKACRAGWINDCPWLKKSMSGGEKAVEEALKGFGVYYEKQKKFEWLKRQTLDFYLPMYKAGIEVQGKQHYKETNIYEDISVIKGRDSEKSRLCTRNGVRLYYYTDDILSAFGEDVYRNIDEMLADIVGNQKKERVVPSFFKVKF